MTVQINGETREFNSESLTVEQLLDKLALGFPVLVELNGQALFQREFPSQSVQTGDQLELFRMVSGG